MLADITDDDPSLDPVRSVVRDEPPAPDPDVVDAARHRLAAQLVPAGQYSGELPAHLIDDLRAVWLVLARLLPGVAGGASARPADALDVGAGLVMLANLRLYLDRLEADLLDGAQRVGLGWDVIAAILGIPASEARDRHLVLRARPDPR
jgi:hypothetical protein